MMKPTASTDRMPDDERLLAVRRTLLRWYRRHRRDLPWRRTRDPYAIWVSEIMLQQTRVDVVVPYYEEFLRRFPDSAALAQASTDAVLQQWAGLGYYSRARNLQRAARRIVDMHDSVFPRHLDDVLALPGIGRYTAGAILSIAFGERQPIVDGNVMRVMARLFALPDRIESRPARQRLWSWATTWADCRNPGDANQALMEIGATVCSRTSPRCHACPIASWCRAVQRGLQEELPRRAARRAAVDVELVAFLVRRRGRLLLVQRGHGDLLQDFWEAPTCALEATPRRSDAARLQATQRRFASAAGLQVDTWRRLGEVRHSILHHRIRLRIVEATGVQRDATRPGETPTRRHRQRQVPMRDADSRTDSGADGGADSASARLQNVTAHMQVRWATAAQTRQRALTTVTHKVLRAAAGEDSSWQQYARHRPTQQTARRRRHEPA
jgi:A/G-specific adenine glycosylase